MASRADSKLPLAACAVGAATDWKHIPHGGRKESVMGYNTEFDGESPAGGSRSCATSLVSHAPCLVKLWYTTAMRQGAKRRNQRNEPKRTYSVAVDDAMSVKYGKEEPLYVDAML